MIFIDELPFLHSSTFFIQTWALLPSIQLRLLTFCDNLQILLISDVTFVLQETMLAAVEGRVLNIDTTDLAGSNTLSRAATRFVSSSTS